MKLSQDGRRFIQHFEDCRLEAYPDGKFWSIGFGHNGPDVIPGMKISKTKAGQLFVEDIKSREDAVVNLVKVPIMQWEFEALVSLVYNIGIQAFAESTLLARLNRGERAAAADHFLRWNKFQGEVLPGLVKRRAAERKRFLGFDLTTSLRAGEEAYALHNERLQGSGN